LTLLPSTPSYVRNQLFTSPRPKSALAKYIKVAQFTPYASTTRPKLLTEMNTTIENELKLLYSKKELLNDNEISQSRVDIFSNVFQLYLDESVIYKSVLERIKFEYESAIKFLKSKVDNLSFMDEILNEVEKKNSEKINNMAKESSTEIGELKSKVALLESNIAKLQSEKNRAENLCNEYRSQCETSQKNYESLRSTSIALAASLSKSEEQTWQVQLLLTAKESEVNELKGSTMKVADEINKLQLIIQVFI